VHALLPRVRIPRPVVAVDTQAGNSDHVVLGTWPATPGLMAPFDVVEARVAALPLLVDLRAGVDARERALA
jgi:hypothetical protein